MTRSAIPLARAPRYPREMRISLPVLFLVFGATASAATCPTDAQMKRLFHYEKTCLNVCAAYFDALQSGKSDEWYACSRFGRGWSCNLRAERCQAFPHLFPQKAYDKNHKRTAVVKQARARLEKEIGEKVNRAATESARVSRTPPRAAPKAKGR